MRRSVSLYNVCPSQTRRILAVIQRSNNSSFDQTDLIFSLKHRNQSFLMMRWLQTKKTSVLTERRIASNSRMKRSA